MIKLIGLLSLGFLLLTIRAEEEVKDDQNCLFSQAFSGLFLLGDVALGLFLHRSNTLKVKAEEERDMYKAQTVELLKKVKDLTNENEELKTELNVLKKKVTIEGAKNHKDKIQKYLRSRLIKLDENVIEEQKFTIVSKNWSNIMLLTSVNLYKKMEEDLNAKIARLNLVIKSQSTIIANFNKKFEECRLGWVKYNILSNAKKTRIEVEEVYSSPTDEDTHNKFQEKAGTVHPNVFIATEEDTGHTFGAFSSIPHNKMGFQEDSTAFTFSLTSYQKCDLVDPAKAIGGHIILRDDIPHYMLVDFGEYDLFVEEYFRTPSSTGKLNPTRIEPNKSYKCPANNIAHFYTENAEAKLSSFKFYSVKFHDF